MGCKCLQVNKDSLSLQLEKNTAAVLALQQYNYDGYFLAFQNKFTDW